MPKLIILTEGIGKREVELKPGRTTIGRAEDNDVVLPEPSVSGHHCEIVIADGQAKIRDLNSTNGTLVDEVQITEAVLRSGQTIRLGMVELRFEDPTAPQPQQAVARPGSRTSPLPRGVNLGEIGQARSAPAKGFERRTSKFDRYFLLGTAIVMALIVVLLIVIFKYAGTR
jgi:pSer/pThr/pTyr-binding forkhead associated (FHA) protein